MVLVYLVISAAWGVVCAYVSKRSGSDPATGFVWGFVLGAVGLGVLFYKAHRRNKTLAQAA